MLKWANNLPVPYVRELATGWREAFIDEFGGVDQQYQPNMPCGNGTNSL